MNTSEGKSSGKKHPFFQSFSLISSFMLFGKLRNLSVWGLGAYFLQRCAVYFPAEITYAFSSGKRWLKPCYSTDLSFIYAPLSLFIYLWAFQWHSSVQYLNANKQKVIPQSKFQKKREKLLYFSISLLALEDHTVEGNRTPGLQSNPFWHPRKSMT